MKNRRVKQAVVLLSGGLDSATVLYLAKAKGYLCRCLIFDYGQIHKKEIRQAKRIAKAAGCAYKILKIKFPWKGSALLDRKIKIPEKINRGIPATYVPSRNIIFLSFAASFAETVGAESIFMGAHAQDYSGYPDCRREFFSAFSKMVKAGTYGGFSIRVPLLYKNKSQIILMGKRLGVPFELTWSCYRGGKAPCTRCDSCYYRAKGFKEARLVDALIK
ncbi:MAG: 7-cyano-7-deazaguanine synthase QueC [Candidatus Omnitrophica bacterium]|nr:7-cyano-7-deazaguanine synthase QueC [Candidatus Omnitrophota bacterium]MBU1924175.1 7-cyano-7-deazaguanine synthase QueC [Candidatus Omnitrophota bacterium]